MRATIHSDGSLHIVFNNVESVQLFDTLQINTVSKDPTPPTLASNLLISLHANGKAFVKDVFSKYKFTEFNVKQLEDFRFKHRIIDVWSTFDTLCARGVMSKQYAQGEKSIGKKGNTYKFNFDISNQ